VPLYYDARGEKLNFVDDDGNQHTVADPKGLNEKIADKLAELEIDDVDVQQRLERELKRDYHLITCSSRLGQIAEDFVQHYVNGWESGKAMLVCIDTRNPSNWPMRYGSTSNCMATAALPKPTIPIDCTASVPAIGAQPNRVGNGCSARQVSKKRLAMPIWH
jgi:hypothetical protein